MTDWLDNASDHVLDAVLRGCGGFRILQIATGVGSLVPRLLDEGVDVHALLEDEGATTAAERLAPGRHRTGTLPAGLPWPDRAFDVVVSTGAVEALDEAAIPAALTELARVSRRAVVLVLAPDAATPPDTARSKRSLWEKRAFAAGLRRHPCAQRIVPLHELERPGAPLILLLERQPDPTAAAEDWLRHAGPAASRLEALHHLAAEFIRPRQTVVVTEAGAGAGAAILARRGEAGRLLALTGGDAGAAARYGTADPRLSFADPALCEPDGRADLVTAIQDTPPDMARLFRWLRPGGRLVVATPAALWPEVAAAFGAELALDRHFLLSTAPGGGLAEQEPGGALTAADGDWCAAVAVRSPFAPVDPAERAERVAAERHHVRAWWRDYDNPRLVEALVNQGERVRNPALLAGWVERALDEARPRSADQGAMLCVRAYRLLEDRDTAWDALEAHLERIDAYCRDADATMHALRWRVSLLYAAGLLFQRGGRLREALDRFTACGETDIRAFSATLGTKTVSAFLKAGRLALALGEPEEGAEKAGVLWRRGMAEARRLLQGDWTNVWGDLDSPFWVETRETAEMVDLALDCANALATLPALETQPGLLREKLDWGRAGMAGELFRLQKEVVRQQGELIARETELEFWRKAASYPGGIVAQGAAVLADLSARYSALTGHPLAHALLARGALPAGWAADRELRRGRRPDRAPPGVPPWDGEAPELEGGRLLVWRDGGLGEELMFSSCLPDLAARGIAVTLECEPRLVALFARSFPSMRVVPAPSDHDAPAPPDCRRHIALTALPGFLRNSLEDFPAEGGWLAADPERAALWQSRLAALGPGRTVGLCWRGGTGGPTALSRLEQWESLLGQAGIHVVSLQYGPDGDEIAAAEQLFQRRIHVWPDLDTTRDLEGVAALIAGLDLVISVPTMVSDLAGALGRPVWRCEWENDWATLGTGRRPWYPTMRLFSVPSRLPLEGAIDAAGRELAGIEAASGQTLEGIGPKRKAMYGWFFFGDSHIEAFQAAATSKRLNAPAKFLRVHGATAVGLRHANSKTNAMEIFSKALLPMLPATVPVMHLGEVDCGFLIWWRAEKHQEAVHKQMEESIEAYFSFVDRLLSAGYPTVVITGATVPSILDGQNWGDVAHRRRHVKATLRERTELTLRYNRRLESEAASRGLPFIDLSPALLDPCTGHVFDKYRNPNPLDHHLHPERTGALWAEAINRVGTALFGTG